MRFVVAILLSLFLFPPALAAPSKTVSLEEPAWITSGAWVRGELVVLDVATNRLAWIRQGRLAPLNPFLSVPTKTHSLGPGGDLLVSSAEDAFWWERVRLSEDGWTIQGSWSCETCGVTDWAPVHEKLVFAVGDVRQEPADDESQAEWLTGFFWVSPAGPELIYQLPETDYPLYLHGLQLLAVAGGNAYAVAPEPIEPSSEGPRRLAILEFPRNQRAWRTLTLLPHLPPELSFQDDTSFAETFAAVSALNGPVRLLAWEERLYLVLRSPLGFEVWHVATDDGGLHFKDTLPSSDFLTVIPGPSSWAVLLKGPVTGFGQQRINSVVHVPAERFR
jgi:hypothetical protein